jgi:hypothetical protein
MLAVQALTAATHDALVIARIDDAGLALSATGTDQLAL